MIYLSKDKKVMIDTEKIVSAAVGSNEISFNMDGGMFVYVTLESEDEAKEELERIHGLITN